MEHELLPTMRILLFLRNLRPNSNSSEIVALHVLKLFSPGSSDMHPQYGRFNLHFLNLIPFQEAQTEKYELTSFPTSPYLFDNIIPDSIWRLLVLLPEDYYSASQYCPVSALPSCLEAKCEKWAVWLSVTISSQAVMKLPFLHSTIYLESFDTDGWSAAPVVGDPEDSILIDDGFSAVLPVDMTSQPFVLGDKWDPHWVNPAIAKHDRQMERLALADSWYITPTMADAAALDSIIQDFYIWTQLVPREKELIWKYRGHLKKNGASLFLFARAVDWNSRQHAEDALKLIYGTETASTAKHTPVETTSAKRAGRQSLSKGLGDSVHVSGPITPSRNSSSTKGTKSATKSHETHLTRPATPPLYSSEKDTPPSTPSTLPPFSPHTSTPKTPFNGGTTTPNQNRSRGVGSHVRSQTDLPNQSPHRHHTTPGVKTPKAKLLEAPWPCRDPIEVLPLLTWQHTPSLRKFVISHVLRQANLEPIILQVVHALHYEDKPVSVSPFAQTPILAEYNGISFDVPTPDPHEVEAKMKASKVDTPLLDLLVERAQVQPLGFYIYWYLAADDELKDQFEWMKTRLRGSSIWDYLERQTTVHEAIRRIGRECTSLSPDLRVRAINNISLECNLFQFSSVGIALPLAPHYKFRAINPNDSYVFKSNNKPIKLSLEVSQTLKPVKRSTDALSSSIAPPSPMGASLSSHNATGTMQHSTYPLALLNSHTKHSSLIQLDVNHNQRSHLDPPMPHSATNPTLASGAESVSSRSQSPTLSPIPSQASLTDSGMLGSKETPALGTSGVYGRVGSSGGGNGISQLNSNFAASSLEASTVKTTYDIIYKNGDDLRQDQLTMTLIRLVDKELKEHQLDLHFVPYEILPLSLTDGIMKCVTGTKSVEDIVKEQKTISSYLRSFNSDDADYERALETYVRSCAGHCVLNMVLGWGDRHAANLLVAKDGHLFHIDFGFILGNEPNWNIFSIMVRLDENMLEPMGPPDSIWRKKFFAYAHDAYMILRQRNGVGSRIISLLYVMRRLYDNTASSNTSNKVEYASSDVSSSSQTAPSHDHLGSVNLNENDNPATLVRIKFVGERLHLGMPDDAAAANLQLALNDAPSKVKQIAQDWWRSFKH